MSSGVAYYKVLLKSGVLSSLEVHAIGISPIEYFFSKTQQAYKNGKETDTIRCSIADYYDYDTGEKVISKDNSTGRMSFDLYDEVIPTVLGANGQENPLSTYKNGDPKVFKVLGTRKFFNGAVWQELSLQEVDKDLHV
jgi:hypothetical protein